MMHDEIRVSILECLKGPTRRPGIYFLGRESPRALTQIVYVGKSGAPSHRIKSHFGRLEFNLAFCLDAIPDHVDHGHLEAAIIACIKPSFNAQSKYDSPHRDDAFVVTLARAKWKFDGLEVPMHMRV